MTKYPKKQLKNLKANKKGKQKIGLVVFKNTTNIGDDIQSYAIKRLLPQVDYYIEREKLNEFIPNEDEMVNVVISGWYNHNVFSFLPSPFINPLFISLHLTNELSDDVPSYFTTYFIEYLKKYEPIGLRDSLVKDQLQKLNVDCYYSGCATLTLSKYEKVLKNDYICLVDIDYFVSAKIKNHYDHVVEKTHYVNEKYTKLDFNKRFDKVEELLKEYQSYKCVITTRLHCALPCLALGVPVLLVYDEENQDVVNRLGEFTKILNFVTKKEFEKDFIDIIDNFQKNPETYKKYSKLIKDKIAIFLNDKSIVYQEDRKFYEKYFLHRQKNFLDIYSVLYNKEKKLSDERYTLLKEKEKELSKALLINKGLSKELELSRENVLSFFEDYLRLNREIYNINNSRSYKLYRKIIRIIKVIFRRK